MLNLILQQNSCITFLKVYYIKQQKKIKTIQSKILMVNEVKKYFFYDKQYSYKKYYSLFSVEKKYV